MITFSDCYDISAMNKPSLWRANAVFKLIAGAPAVLTEGHRRLPKADVGDVVRRRQGRIQGGGVRWLRKNPLTLRNTETLQKKFNDFFGRLNADIVDTIIEQNLSD